MPKCTICHHPQRQDIDQALLAENATFAALSQQYGPSLSSLFRHKKHLEEKMIQARQRLKNSQAQGCLLKLNAFLDHVQGAVRTAEADGNVDQVLKGSHVGSRIIHQINQMEVPLELDTVYRLISSPQWTSQDSLLPTDPQLITGIHQALADHAFCPCPEPEPEMIPAATHSSLLEIRNSELETPEPCPELPLDPQVDAWDEEYAADADLAQTTCLETCNSKLETPSSSSSSLFPLPFSQASTPPPKIETCCFPLETAPKIQREISAKLPKKLPLSEEYNQQYQNNRGCEKNVPKNPQVGRENTRRAAYAQAPPANQPLETRNSELETPKPCPLPVESLPPAPGNREPETNYSEPETPLPPGITPELLRQILRRLDEPPLTQPKTENRKLATANHPPNQREISAK